MDSSTPNRTFLYIAACAANIVTFICGTAFGWTSPVIPHLQNLTASPLDHIISSSEEAWIGSFLPLAATVGPVAGGVLANMIGRKKTLLIATLPFLLAYAVNIFAAHVSLFYAARFLCGLGAGITFTVLPMYIGEISDNEVRGALGSFIQLFGVSGMVFSYALGPYLSVKMFNMILLLPPAICIIMFSIFVPDSPYYLIQSGKTEKALEVLVKLRGQQKSKVQKEIETITKQLKIDQENKGGIMLILKSKGLRTAICLSFSLVSFQQLSGVNVVFYYTQSIFTDAGVLLAPEICTIIVGVIQVISSAPSLFIVEKSGKRLLLIISGVGMAISQGMLAYYFYLKEDLNVDVSSLSSLPILSLVMYTITYCVGFGPLPWAISGELFPGNVKPIASAATSSCCWTFAFLLINYFGLITTFIGKVGSFGIFGGFSLISVAFVYFFVPETTGKSLDEIQAILSGNIKERQNSEDVEQKY